MYKKKKQFKRILTLINCFIHQKLIFGVPMKSSDYFLQNCTLSSLIIKSRIHYLCNPSNWEKEKEKVFQYEIQIIIFTHCPHHTYLYKHTHTRSLSLTLSLSLSLHPVCNLVAADSSSSSCAIQWVWLREKVIGKIWLSWEQPNWEFPQSLEIQRGRKLHTSSSSSTTT
jgi:hypothetical protein